MSETTKVYSMVTYVEGPPTIKKQVREVTREIKKNKSHLSPNFSSDLTARGSQPLRAMPSGCCDGIK